MGSWTEQPAADQVGAFDLSQLQVDQAILNVTSTHSSPLWLYALTSSCYSCPFTRLDEVPHHLGYRSTTIDTTWPTKYRFRIEGSNTSSSVENDEYTFCEFGQAPSFQEFGVYNVNVTGNYGTSASCVVTVAAQPVNIYYPLVIAVCLFLILGLAAFVIGLCWKRWKTRSQLSISSSSDNFPISPAATSTGEVSSSRSQSLSSQPPKDAASTSKPTTQSSQHNRQRLRSLDTFRGLSIVVMIFVNYGGGKYTFFEHAIWDGLTVADLVFPWFLWIMGVCIPLSIKSQVKRATPRIRIFKAIVIRSLKLFGLGILLNSLGGPVQFGEYGNLRVPGVLQRFGVCYFVCSTLVLCFMQINFSKPDGTMGKVRAAVQDISVLWVPWIPIVGILVAHCLLTFYLPVPGCPTGYLGPGGLDLNMNGTITAHCIGGAAGYIDLQVLSASHIYNHPTARATFQTGPYDPEGLLGTLTSIFQTWLGVQTGATMLVYPRPWSRLKRWGIWGLVAGGIGAILCHGKMTGGWIPVNKNLWSISFVLVTSCFANVLLCVMYFVIDMRKWCSGSPFFESGMNSILLYMGHNILSSCLPWRWSDGQMQTHFIRLIENIWATTLWTMIGIWLHRKKIYWSV